MVKKPKANEVYDSEGRRRFHGAFTGGFSAGYFNTVCFSFFSPSFFSLSFFSLIDWCYAHIHRLVAKKDGLHLPFLPLRCVRSIDIVRK